MTVGDKLREFAVYTSCHGIPHIATARKWPIRLFWVSIVVGASVLVVIDVKQLYDRYEQHPKIVQSEIKFEELPFPAVTICNLNPIRQSQVAKVPQLQQLLTACDLPIDKSQANKTVDYCQAARDSYAAMKNSRTQATNEARATTLAATVAGIQASTGGATTKK